MSAYFVTATGTDIGKTFVTAGLIRHLRRLGKPVAALKPLVSGYDEASAAASDPGVLLGALGEAATPEAVARLAPWRFAAPLSPDMAAAREGRGIDFAALVGFCRDAAAARTGTLFIEGVGGIMVPLDGTHTVLDWLAALGLPLIVVAGSYLGTLSHTLTALRVVAAAKLDIAALVVNESADSTVLLEETAAALARFAPDVPIVALRRGEPDFAALAERLK
ncbi:MAG: dethiobiotin synthase [Rhizomicrobium sp.]